MWLYLCLCVCVIDFTELLDWFHKLLYLDCLDRYKGHIRGRFCCCLLIGGGGGGGGIVDTLFVVVVVVVVVLVGIANIAATETRIHEEGKKYKQT